MPLYPKKDVRRDANYTGDGPFFGAGPTAFSGSFPPGMSDNKHYDK